MRVFRWFLALTAFMLISAKVWAQSPVADLPFGDRIATSDANIRATPNINSAVVGRLKPGDRFNVGAVSADKQWHRVEIVPVVTGWVSTPVLAKMSKDADPGAATRPVPLQQIMLLITGILQPPYNDELITYAPPGKPFQIERRAYTYRQIDDCHIELTTTYVTRRAVTDQRWDESTTTAATLFDFTKLTGVTTKYEKSPWESFAGNPRPRMLTLVKYRGKGALCDVPKNGGAAACDSDPENIGYYRDLPHTTFDLYAAAYQAVRRRCLSSR